MESSNVDQHSFARRRLKLRQLEILLAVADTGSMAKAAMRLAISQPGISRAIADMEHTLGVSLFDRNTQGVEPTQYGRALLKRGIAAFDEIDHGLKDIEYLADPTAGEVHIGSSAALSEGIILAIINRLLRQHPRVVFNVAIDHGIDQLRERNVELCFVNLSGLAREADIDQETLFEEPLVVVAGAENPWVLRRKIKLAELVNEPWTWPPPGSAMDSLVIKAFTASGLKPPRAAVYTHGLNMRVCLAATGPFLSVVPAGIICSPGKYPSIRMLPVELPATHRPIGIVTLKNRSLSPLAQIFIKSAREMAKPQTKKKS